MFVYKEKFNKSSKKLNRVIEFLLLMQMIAMTIKIRLEF